MTQDVTRLFLLHYHGIIRVKKNSVDANLFISLIGDLPIQTYDTNHFEWHKSLS